MKLRIARHTNNLDKIISFYTHIVGLEELGSFQKHDKYSGIFLGKKGQDWHLEFTVSDEIPQHTPDPDDLLVFYLSTEKEYQDILARFSEHGIEKKTAKNPYWNKASSFYLDPDGFGVIITKSK
jgi:catechol-2,3-dioxygenase